jgi:cytochrome P450
MLPEQKFDLNSQEFYRNSHDIFAELREVDPIFQQTSPYGTRMWYVTRYEDVDAVLRDSERFVVDFRRAFDEGALKRLRERPGFMDMVNNHLLTKDGADHHRLRALVNKAFTPRMVASMRPRIQQIAEKLLDQVEGKNAMDLVEEYAFQLPITVIAEMLGIPVEDRDQFREWSDAFVTAPFTSGFEDNKFMEGAMGFVMYLGKLFEERRQNPRSDLISGLLQAEEEGDRLNTEELFSMVILLIIAGHETTVTLIGNAMVVIMEHPELYGRLREHPEEMSQAVEEFLRYESPVQRSIARWATVDTMLGDKEIHRGDMLVAVLGSANRDDEIFTHPEEVDIDRESNNSHMAFGKGIHYCLGAPLARLEGEIALNTLLRRLPNLRLAVPERDLQYRQTPLFHAFEHIPVKWGE